MSTFLSATVVATPQGKLSVSAKYLFGIANITLAKDTTANQKTQFPGAQSVLFISYPLNNSKENLQYFVGESLTTLNT